MANYSIDDEFGNQITAGLASYDAAKQSARRYLSAHKGAPAVTIYNNEGEFWELQRNEVVL